jgi:D-alanine-D-alanine ligase
MAKKKLRIGILFGGRSGEHEVSLLSAASILKAIDRRKYDVVPIGIDKQGRWLTGGEANRLLASNPLAQPAVSSAAKPEDISEAAAEFAISAAVLRSGEPLNIPPLPPQRRATDSLQHVGSAELAQPGNPLPASLDVVFPVLHGTFGEDGTIQGLFELADIAYVGSGVLGSSAAMDKDAMKRLFAAAGLTQTPYVALLRSEWRADPRRATRLIEKSLAYPGFGEPRQFGRHQQSARPRRAGRRTLARRQLRPQAGDRAGRRRAGRQAARARSLGAGQRRAPGIGGRRDRPQQGVLRLRVEVRAVGKSIHPDHSREAQQV